MVTQELMKAFMRERMLEAARLQLEDQARAADGQSARPRLPRSALRIGRLSLPTFVSRVFRSAPA
jgi:hypothetical protein